MRASLKTDQAVVKNRCAGSPSNEDDEDTSTTSKSPRCDSSISWDVHQNIIDPEVHLPNSKTFSVQNCSGKLRKNYFAIIDKWVAARKSWEKIEKSYQERIRTTEAKILKQEALESARLKKLMSVKEHTAESSVLKKELECATLRITELQAQLQRTTNKENVLEQRCRHLYISSKFDEEANSVHIADLRSKVAVLEDELARAKKNIDPDLEEKLLQYEEKITEQNL